jgi:hypothetical protein
MEVTAENGHRFPNGTVVSTLDTSCGYAFNRYGYLVREGSRTRVKDPLDETALIDLVDFSKRPIFTWLLPESSLLP